MKRFTHSTATGYTRAELFEDIKVLEVSGYEKYSGILKDTDPCTGETIFSMEMRKDMNTDKLADA